MRHPGHQELQAWPWLFMLHRSLASHLNLSGPQFLIVKSGRSDFTISKNFPNHYIYDLFRASVGKGRVFQIAKAYLFLWQSLSLPEAFGMFFCITISTVSRNMALPSYQMMWSLWPSLPEEKQREQGKNDFSEIERGHQQGKRACLGECPGDWQAQPGLFCRASHSVILFMALADFPITASDSLL